MWAVTRSSSVTVSKACSSREGMLPRLEQHSIRGCGDTAVIEFGTTFSQQGARLDERVYVGPFCTLGRVHLEADVLVASGVHIPSGAHTHGTSNVIVPIREQEGMRRLVTVGAGSW